MDIGKFMNRILVGVKFFFILSVGLCSRQKIPCHGSNLVKSTMPVNGSSPAFLLCLIQIGDGSLHRLKRALIVKVERYKMIVSI
ncbi:hypothetical protein D7V82_14300 [bacterium 1xD8-6]|nr:hypothetical protein D7V72_15720 [bacterium D16-36]RKI66802.1 hypothetical protein D7V82_14300 [bacterium 1xD8-6]